MIANKNYIVDPANLQDKKLMIEFAKQIYFDGKALGINSPGDKSPTRLLKSPAVKAPAISTMFLPENPNELCDRLKLLLQDKQAGVKSNIIDEEIIAKADKFLK